MGDYLFRLFDSSDWVPRTACGEWSADLIWMHLISDFLIWFSYMAIPVSLLYFTHRRKDIPFHWIFWMFGWFIVSCGFTHFVELFAFRSPMYRLSGVVKALTAVASVATVVSLIVVMPRVLALPGLGALLAGLSREASQRRIAEERIESLNRDLKQRVDELQTLLELTPVAIAFAHGRECRNIAMNRECARLLGLPSSANASKSVSGGEKLPFRVFQNGRELSAEELPMQRAAATGKAVENVAVELKCDDGRHVHLIENAAPLFNESGAVRGAVGVFVDISGRVHDEERRRTMETRMLEAQKLESLGVLAGGIAHDFNNLLVGVLGNAELARNTLPAGAPALRFLERVENAAHLAADLTRQMLAYSGKGRFVVDRVNVSELMRDMIALLEASISKKAVLRYRFEPDLPDIEADSGQISQVLMNLIVNASEALGERGGTISLHTDTVYATRDYLRNFVLADDCPEGQYVSLEVNDDGCGMPPDVQARIFEPFFTTKFAGRGLGLAAVQGIVRAHGGTMRVYSEPGRGTTFKLLFPAARVGPASANAAADRGALATTVRAGTILFVDDEAIVREVGDRALTAAGHRVILAEDGQQAVDLIRERGEEIDLVLLDMMMPRLGGEEAFREIRKLIPDMPVVLSSGYNEQDAISNFVGRGLAGFLQKPFGSADLVAKVDMLLTRNPRRVQRET